MPSAPGNSDEFSGTAIAATILFAKIFSGDFEEIVKLPACTLLKPSRNHVAVDERRSRDRLRLSRFRLRHCRLVFHSELGKRRGSDLRETIKDHLQALSTVGRNVVEGADFVLLEWVFREIMEVSIDVQDVLPVSNHPEVAELGEYPVAFLKRIFAASQAGHE